MPLNRASIGGTAISIGGAVALMGTTALTQLPDLPSFTAGPTSVPQELSLVNRQTEAQFPGFNNDRIALMALENSQIAEGWDYTATQDGFFDDPATWGGLGVPGNGDTASIPDGRVVWVKDNIGALKLLWNYGFLGIHYQANVTINIDTIVTARTGRFWAGDENQPFVGTLDWVFPTADIDLAFDPRLQTKGFMCMGRSKIHGKSKAAYVLTNGADLLVGATSLELVGTPVGWMVGDTIVIPPTRMIAGAIWGAGSGNTPEPGNEVEVRVITGISGNTVSWVGGLIHDHSMPVQSTTRDLHIINTTRNIKFRSDVAALVHQRGHFMCMASDDHDLRYIEFAYLGRTDKRTMSWDIDDHPDHIDNGGAGITPVSSIKGRYGAVHFHACGPDGANIKVMGCVVYGAFSLGFVSHSSNVDFISNASANMWGAGMFTEAGNEDGLVNGFVGTGHKTDLRDISNKNHIDEARHDWGHAQIFWMQSRIVKVENIAVYGCSNGAGAVWNTRGAKSTKNRARTFERRNIRAITRNAENFFDDADLLPEQENYQHIGASISTPPLDVNGVRIVACMMSGQVEKSGSQQDHFLYSHVQNVELINVAKGWHFEYTGRYIYEESISILQSGLEGFAEDFDNGLRLAIESYQFTIRGASSYGHMYGVKVDHVVLEPTGAEDREIIPDEKWHNFLITPQIGTATIAMLEPTFGTGVNANKDTIINESALNLDPSFPLMDFVGHDVEIPTGGAGAYNSDPERMNSTITDSVGSRDLPAGRDTAKITQAQLWGNLRMKGFWVEQGTGRCFFEMTETLSDAVTGVRKDYERRVYLAEGIFSNDPRGAPTPWITGPWVNNGTKV